MLTIIAAMEQELSGLRRALPADSIASVELHVVGVGKEPAQSSLRKILDAKSRSSGDGLLLLGFAGGLDPVLQAGDLVVPNYYYAECGDRIAADPDMWRQSQAAATKAAMPVAPGDSLTVAAVAATSEEKRELYRRHRIGSVNMEDYWAAELATDAGVPFLSARAILDPVHQALPSYLVGFSGRPIKAALRVMPKPWRVLAILELVKLRNKAQASLTSFGLAFIKHQQSAGQRQKQAFR